MDSSPGILEIPVLVFGDSSPIFLWFDLPFFGGFISSFCRFLSQFVWIDLLGFGGFLSWISVSLSIHRENSQVG